jgi:hypothetical protein
VYNQPIYQEFGFEQQKFSKNYMEMIGGLKRAEVMHNFYIIVEFFLSNNNMLHAHFT